MAFLEMRCGLFYGSKFLSRYRLLRAFFALALTFFSTVSRFSLANCEINLLGADHLTSQYPDGLRFVVENLQSYVIKAERPQIQAYFLGVFGDIQLRFALAQAGVNRDRRQLIEARLMEIARKIYSPGNTSRLILNGFTQLTNNHQPQDSTINVCIMGQGCPQFNVRNLDRPFVSMFVAGPLSLQYVGNIDHDQLRKTPDFYFNTIFLRADSSPEEFVADFFSGLGSAAMMYIMRGWALTKTWQTNPNADRLFAKFGRVIDGKALLDQHFFEFMKVMAGHMALVEYLAMMPGKVPVESLGKPGRLATIPSVFQNLSEGTLRALNALGINVANAQDVFQEAYSMIFKSVEKLDTSHLH